MWISCRQTQFIYVVNCVKKKVINWLSELDSNINNNVFLAHIHQDKFNFQPHIWLIDWSPEQSNQSSDVDHEHLLASYLLYLAVFICTDSKYILLCLLWSSAVCFLFCLTLPYHWCHQHWSPQEIQSVLFLTYLLFKYPLWLVQQKSFGYTVHLCCWTQNIFIHLLSASRWQLKTSHGLTTTEGYCSTTDYTD